LDAPSAGRNVSESVIKVTAAGALADWFAPHDAVALSNADVDLGSAGPMLLPDQTGAHAHLVIGTGKPGYLYLLDRDQMGHYSAVDDSQIVQKVSVVPNTTGDLQGIFATPVYFGGRVYVGAGGDTIRAYSWWGVSWGRFSAAGWQIDWDASTSGERRTPLSGRSASALTMRRRRARA
jgi:hypothetical protein